MQSMGRGPRRGAGGARAPNAAPPHAPSVPVGRRPLPTGGVGRKMMQLDPITVEVIGAAMASIVEETGETLIRASHSTNIKERRDCSTALFNAAGATRCEAEHIPIHLGSFLDLIKHIMRRYPTQDIRPGHA